MDELAALEALEKNPASASLWFQLGRAFHRKQQWQGAQEAYLQALQREKQLPEGWVNLGLVFRALSQWSHAQECFEKALAVRPDNPDALTNLGNLLAFLGDLAPALACHEKAVALAPTDGELVLNWANALTKAGELEQAETLYAQVVAQHPQHVVAHWNFSHNLLLQGQFQRGFEAFEWRLNRPGLEPRWHAPKWDGRPLPEGSLLIEAEQGLGDSLQFIRFAQACAQRVKRVVVRGPPRLAALLRDVEGVSAYVSSKEPPPACDAQVMMMSLPWALGLKEVPAFRPYLRARTDLVEVWAQRLPKTKWKIGICGEGSKAFEADALRSPGLSWFREVAAIPGVSCVSLQQKTDTGLVDFPLTVFENLDQQENAFLDTAAVIQSLDVVVTSDTSVAHLAGSMGRPVWVVLPFSPDWRWQLHTSSSPWYPSMRLFRQEKPKDWSLPFGQVAAALRQLVSGM